MRVLADLLPTDPRVGLAIDEALLENVRAGGPDAIRLWINRRAVVVGRSQSVADEVDEVLAVEAGVPVLRRISGGGAVYHYPGNLNLSIAMSRHPGIGSVAEVFRALGGAIATGLAPWADVACDENALRVGDRKIGGAAQARRGDAVLYHTTLLLTPDEIPIDRLLLAHRPGYAPKGPASRPAKTITLAEACGGLAAVSDIAEALLRALEARLQRESQPSSLTDDEVLRSAELVLKKYGTDEWNRSH